MNNVLPKDTITQRQLEALESEAISTSAIEGEVLNRDSVKASIKRKLGMEDFIGGLSKKKYMKIADTTDNTASRGINGLINIGCIKQIEGTVGRNTNHLISYKKY